MNVDLQPGFRLPVCVLRPYVSISGENLNTHRVVPLLCYDCEVDGYTRAVLGNGSVNTFLLLDNRVLILQQLYFNNGRDVSYVVRAERL
jgi:hypothetical protein